MPIAKYRSPLQIAALGLTALLALGLSGVLTPRPAPRYAVTDLGVLPGYAESSASAMNDRGDVAVTVGQAAGRQACVYQNGRLTGLGVVPGGSDAEGINAAGDIVGLTGLPGARRAFLYRGSRMRVLGLLPGFTDCEGVAINDRGEVTGTAATSPGPMTLPHEHAFLYANGRMMDIGTPPGCSESQAASINAAGLVTAEGFPFPGGSVRSRPFLYDSRTRAMTLLPVPPRAWCAWASRTSDTGQTVGAIWTGSGRYHVALWAGGRLKDLGAAPDFGDSVGVGLNDQGEAIGHSSEEHTREAVRAFLRDNAGGNNALKRYLSRPTDRAFVCEGGRMRDLSELTPASAGWTLEHARAINDKGQVVGDGLHDGQQRAFLLTPVP